MMKFLARIRQKLAIHSLQVQLILYFTCFSFAVLAAGTYLNNQYTWEMFERNNERYLLQQFRQADNNINTVINDIDRLSMIFIADESIQEFLLENYNTQDFSAYELKEAVFSRISDFTSDYSNYMPYSYINSIYIYTENKGCIGGSDTHSVVFTDEKDSESFFSSAFYHSVREAFPQIVLHGGITERFYRNYKAGSQPYIISIGREVKPVTQPDRTASLIFNVDERYIASIYAASQAQGAGSMYILEPDGTAISSSSGENVGGVSPVIGLIDQGSPSGSFTLEEGPEPVQVVYAKISNTDWFLVGEIPLSYLQRDMMTLQRTAVIVFAASVIVIFLTSYFWLSNIMGPLRLLARKMQDVGRGELGLTVARIPSNEFGIVIRGFNEMSLGIRDLMEKQERVQQEKRELEIEALQSQINPHFLYNTLNMIKWMAAILKARNIVDCIVALGNILLPAYQSTDATFTLGDEINYLENYIKIVNWRFDNRVRFEIAVGPDLMGCLVPKFMLQPIIENAITHGMPEPAGELHTRIDAQVDGGDLVLVIADSGAGMTQERLREITMALASEGSAANRTGGSSIGIRNVHRRIRLNYGQSYGISLQSTEGEGTRVTIRLPIMK